MAYYQPDHLYHNGKDYLDEICAKDDEKSIAIKHYLEKELQYRNELLAKIEEYNKFFEQLRRLSGAAAAPVIYG
jgi:hypothetical protein